MKTCSLRKTERIKTAGEFSRIFKTGRHLRFSGFRVCVSKNSLGCNRIGLSVGKKVGGAVIRNRIKRRIREIFRQNKIKFGDGFDMVFMPDTACATMDWQKLTTEFEKLARRLG